MRKHILKIENPVDFDGVLLSRFQYTLEQYGSKRR